VVFVSVKFARQDFLQNLYKSLKQQGGNTRHSYNLYNVYIVHLDALLHMVSRVSRNLTVTSRNILRLCARLNNRLRKLTRFSHLGSSIGKVIERNTCTEIDQDCLITINDKTRNEDLADSVSKLF
jgi:hypothetical protein